MLNSAGFTLRSLFDSGFYSVYPVCRMKVLPASFLIAIPSGWGSTLPFECEKILSEAGVPTQWTEVQESPEWVRQGLNPQGWHERYTFYATTVYGRAPAFGLAQAVAFHQKRKFHESRRPQLDRELYQRHFKSGEFQEKINQQLKASPKLLCGILAGQLGMVCSLVATVTGTVSIPAGLAFGALSGGFSFLAALPASREVIQRHYVRLPERTMEELAGPSWRVREALLSPSDRSPITERFLFTANGHFLFVEAVVPEDAEKEVQMDIHWAAPLPRASGG